MTPEAEITMKNTKAEMLEDLSDALTWAEAAEKGRLNPDKTAQSASGVRLSEAPSA